MVKKQSKIMFASVFAFAAMMLSACNDPLPQEDLVNAKSAISDALDVKADVYSPKEMTDATAKLYEAHGLAADAKMSDASSSAKEAEALARAAFNKALPAVAKETLDTATESVQKAEGANAETLAPEEYLAAKSALTTATTNYENKDYEVAYKTAVTADAKAKEALSVALENKDVLKDAIDEVKLTLEKAGEYNAEEYASENMKLAAENLEVAEQALADGELKKCSDAIETAKVNADEAYTKALKETASAELAKTKALIDEAKKSKAGKVAEDEIAAAEEAYKNAEAMYAEGRYKEAIEYSREAAMLSNVVAAQEGGKDNDSEQETDSDEDDKDYVLYTVKYNAANRDCLWKIANRYYKNPRQWKRIYNANKDKISNPDLIYPGWVLKVPKEK